VFTAYGKVCADESDMRKMLAQARERSHELQLELLEQKQVAKVLTGPVPQSLLTGPVPQSLLV